MATAAGCGGGGSTAPSRADFVKRANAICRRVNNELASVGPVQSAADVQRIGPRVIASEQRGLADLRSLRPPASLRADWQRLLADLAKLSANANRLLAASKANDTATAQQIANASTQVQAEITSVAGRDGLTDCAKG